MFMDDQTETLLRLHIADPATAEGGPLLSYDDLSALYRGESGSLPRTVAAALRTIAASEVLVSKKIRTQDLQTDGPAVSAELRALAARYRARAAEIDAAADEWDGFDIVGGRPGPRPEHTHHEVWGL